MNIALNNLLNWENVDLKHKMQNGENFASSTFENTFTFFYWKRKKIENLQKAIMKRPTFIIVYHHYHDGVQIWELLSLFVFVFVSSSSSCW